MTPLFILNIKHSILPRWEPRRGQNREASKLRILREGACPSPPNVGAKVLQPICHRRKECVGIMINISPDEQGHLHLRPSSGGKRFPHQRRNRQPSPGYRQIQWIHITMQIAAIHYHPLLNPFCLSGFTLIPESEEWLTDRDLLVMFMLWKMNKAWRRSVWVQSRLSGAGRVGLRDVVGGWEGGVAGWRAAWRPQGLQARSAEKSSFFLQYARQVLESSETS